MRGSFRWALAATLLTQSVSSVCPPEEAQQHANGVCQPCAGAAPAVCMEIPAGALFALEEARSSVTAYFFVSSVAAGASLVVLESLLYYESCAGAYRVCPNPGVTARFVVARTCAWALAGEAACAALTTCPNADPMDPMRFRSTLSGACEPCPNLSAGVLPSSAARAPAYSLAFCDSCLCDAGAQMASHDDACELCSLNTFKSVPGAGQCLPCPVAWVVVVGVTQVADCRSCPAGTVKLERLGELPTLSNLICLRCPRSLATLREYTRCFFLADRVWERAGSFKQNMWQSVWDWKDLVFSRTACAPGTQRQSPPLATADSSYEPCPAGQYCAGGVAFACAPFANASGFVTGGDSVFCVVYTLPGNQTHTFATTGRASAPECGYKTYTIWEYPVRRSGNDTVSFAFSDHIERPLLAGAQAKQCTGALDTFGAFDMLLA